MREFIVLHSMVVFQSRERLRSGRGPLLPSARGVLFPYETRRSGSGAFWDSLKAFGKRALPYLTALIPKKLAKALIAAAEPIKAMLPEKWRDAVEPYFDRLAVEDKARILKELSTGKKKKEQAKAQKIIKREIEKVEKVIEKAKKETGKEGKGTSLNEALKKITKSGRLLRL